MNEPFSHEGFDAVRSKYSVAAHEAEVSEQEPVNSSNTGASGDGVPGFKFLHSLMTATLFSDFFIHHAEVCKLHETRQERVSALKDEHPRFYKLCRNFDFVTRGVLWLLLVGTTSVLVLGTAWRVLWNQ